MGDWPAQTRPPPLTALAASPGPYSNWIDLYDGTNFRWHQFWAARSHWGPWNQVCTFGAARWMPAQSRRDFGGEQFDAKPVFVCGMRDGRTGVVFFRVKRTGPADKDAVTAAIDWISPGEAAVAGPTAWLDPGAEAAGPPRGPLPHRGAPALRWREEAAQAAARRPRARRPVGLGSRGARRTLSTARRRRPRRRPAAAAGGGAAQRADADAADAGSGPTNIRRARDARWWKLLRPGPPDADAGVRPVLCQLSSEPHRPMPAQSRRVRSDFNSF